MTPERGHRHYGPVPVPDFARHFGGGSPPKVPPPEPPPQRNDADVQKREAEARLRARNRKGRKATILGGESTPDVVAQQEKELLGA